MRMRNLLALENMGPDYPKSDPDELATTTPEDAPLTRFADVDAPTVGGTTEPQRARVTRHMEITVGNSYRRSDAILAERDYYEQLGLRVTTWGEIQGVG